MFDVLFASALVLPSFGMVVIGNSPAPLVFSLLQTVPLFWRRRFVDEADDRATRLVLDALALPDDPALRARLRPVAAYVKSLCREWLERGTVTRATVHADVCAAVMNVVG